MPLDDELALHSPDRPSIVTIGVFDGVHVGHQALVRRTIEEARGRGCASGVVVFHPHPRDVLVPGTQVPVLTPLEDRVRLLKDLGVDIVVPVSFTLELSGLSARQFMSSLIDHLRLAGIVSGPDFAVGKDREGDLPALTRLGAQLGYTVTVIEPLGEPARKISSSAIRNAVGSGEVKTASRLLGRPYSTRGKVVHGAARGRTLGYPTANLRIEGGVALPGDGIYATWAHTDGQRHPSAAYVGKQPTFDGRERSIEIFLLDFEGDLYGDDLEVRWVEKLRDDKKFDSQSSLLYQMKEDVRAVRMELLKARLRMGFTRKTVLLRNLDTGQDLLVEMLVDSGSRWSAIPQAEADKLGLRSKGTRPMRQADGSIVEWDYGYVEITIAGRTAPDLCFYSDRVDEPLLGVNALQAVDLGLDPNSEDFIEFPPGRFGFVPSEP